MSSPRWPLLRPEEDPVVMRGPRDLEAEIREAKIFAGLPVSAEIIQLDWPGIDGGWGVKAAAYTNARKQPRLALIPLDHLGRWLCTHAVWQHGNYLRHTELYETRSNAPPHIIEILLKVTEEGLTFGVKAPRGMDWHPSEPEFFQQIAWKELEQ